MSCQPRAIQAGLGPTAINLKRLYSVAQISEQGKSEMQLKLTELLVSYNHIANRRIDFVQIIVNFRLTGKHC